MDNVTLLESEISEVMQRSLNGEMSEADAATTIILLQAEVIRLLREEAREGERRAA